MSESLIEALSLADYARLARQRLAPPVWDFFEGGAGQERTLAGNLEAFDRMRILPSVLTGMAEPKLATDVLGRTWAAPIAIAPMAYQTLACADGETATVRAAGEAGLPVVVSTFAGRSFAELAAHASSPLWLQLYCFRDHATTAGLVARAEAAGFEAIVLTVDAPRLGRRLRDLRNGFRLPDGIAPANFEPGGNGYARPAAHALAEFESTLDWKILERLRSITKLPILVKGVLSGVDAGRAVEAGADGIIVSNHGGRQLDGVIATLDALPGVAAVVNGACPVLLDGGIRRGTDVLTALALGADAVLLGRPVLHGLAVDGEDGVRHVLGLLVEELTDAMVLTGTASAAGVPADLVHRPVARMAELHAGVADPVMDTMNFLNEITVRHPDAISFAPGRPYDGFFDTEQIFTYLRRYLDHLAAQGIPAEGIRDTMFQYGPAAGRIRDLIAASLLADEGLAVAPESIVVTVGCQEAMFLVLRALMTGPGDVLIVSSPCYVGITGAARLLDVPVVPVEERETGLSAVDVESAVLAEIGRGRRPRAVYVVPDHSNPSGTTMPLEARRALLDVAERHDLLVLEDSPYRLMSASARVPTLKSLDRTRRVIQLGSFAKTVFPGARVGYLVADQRVTLPDGRSGPLADQLAKIKSMITVNTPSLSQAAVAGALLSFDGHLAELNRETSAYYDNAMTVTLDRLDRSFPPAARERLGVRWNRPSGGFFVKMDVGFVADDAALNRSAEEFGVIWTPMSYFYPAGGGERQIRLSISYLTDAEITEGVARLVRFIETETARQKPE